MLAPTTTTTQAKPLVLVTMVLDFVTLAYAWGCEDGAQGKRRQGVRYWTFDDPRQAEYRAGYTAGCLDPYRDIPAIRTA